MPAQKITIHGFLNEFKRRHEQMPDRPFCWILGSGSSVQSGIPTGKTLANQWLQELQDLEDEHNLGVEQWATAANLGIPGFEYKQAENFYPWIYQRRFSDYKDQGYAFLENVMDHAEPSFGYSVLAQIMATTPHKVAVTTNFDNLVADALSIYTRTFPLVCGHESLTGYIRPNLRRPLVAKIHRDLLLAPLSNPDDIARLPGEWAAALTKIFERSTPIVIGYGGNDGSLMGFLRTLAPIEGGIFWCWREGGKIDQNIHEVVEHHHGRLVPIAGFDEVMLQLQEKLKLSFLLPKLQSAHEKRVTSYQKQFEALTAALSKPAETEAAEEARKPAREAAEAAVERLTKEKSWWAWELKARAEQDSEKRKEIYRAGLEDFPESAELTGNFAVMMERAGDNAEAERLYARAFQLDPNNATVVGNFAWSLYKYKNDYSEAEKLYHKSFEIDPNQVNNINNFATLQYAVHENYDEAERLYRKALDLDPNHYNTVASFAVFIEAVRKDYDEAERLYRRAFELDPSNATNIANFADFIAKVRKDYDEAERLYHKSLELQPNHAPNIANFADFIARVRKDYDEAERLYRKALELEPENANIAGNFAQILGALNRVDEAREFTMRAWRFLDKTPSGGHAEMALTRWLLDRASDRDGSGALGRLKTILQHGFRRYDWSFDELLATLTPRLSEAERQLASKLVAAILDETKVPALADEPIWKAVAPIALDVPWPE